MIRKIYCHDEDYHDLPIHCQRLRALVDEKQKPVAVISDEIGVSRQSFDRWMGVNPKRGIDCPTAYSLRLLAEYFGVSCDWILGLSDKKERV